MAKVGQRFGFKQPRMFDEPRKFQKRNIDNKTLLLRILKYIGKKKIILYGIFSMVILVAVLNATRPAILGKIIDALTLAYQEKHLEMSGFSELILILIAVSFFAGCIHYIQGYFSARLVKQMIFDLRDDCYNALLSLPITYLDKNSHGDTMSRLVNDTETVAQVLSQTMASLFSHIVSIVSITAIMLYFSPLLTLLVFIFLPLTIFATKKLSKKLRLYYKKKHEALGKLEGYIEENLFAYETLLAYNQRENVSQKFNIINDNYREVATKSNILSNLLNPILSILSGFTYVLIALVGAYLAIIGSITIGTIQTFLLYIGQLTQPLNGLSSLYGQIQTALAGAERIFEILDAEKEPDKGDIPTQPLNGDIQISTLSFEYKSQKPVLEDFNLHIKAREKVAIVGKTGSGKTSIINVLLRFYPYQSGTIHIDGKELSQYDLGWLRKNIAHVQQEPFIFSGTVKDNIRYGKQNATEEEIMQAANSANVHDFIMQLPKKYETLITTDGGGLSVGQKQLICLARTFLMDAPILILDEATANVDTLTEMRIQDAILKLMEKKTCIVIAHRLSTIIRMNRIIVLDEGKIIESGTHKELLEKNGKYFDLYTQ